MHVQLLFCDFHERDKSLITPYLPPCQRNRYPHPSVGEKLYEMSTVCTGLGTRIVHAGVILICLSPGVCAPSSLRTINSLPSPHSWVRAVVTIRVGELVLLFSLPAMTCFIAGRLRHLSGLSLSQNPLENPPQYAIKNGTKVLQNGCVYSCDNCPLNFPYGHRQCCSILESSSKNGKRGGRGRKVSAMVDCW